MRSRKSESREDGGKWNTPTTTAGNVPNLEEERSRENRMEGVSEKWSWRREGARVKVGAECLSLSPSPPPSPSICCFSFSFSFPQECQRQEEKRLAELRWRQDV